MSDSALLLLIDIKTYKIQWSSNSTIILTDEQDIDNLNKLQILNCFEIAFFHQRQDYDYIKKIHEESEILKVEKTFIEKKYRTVSCPNGGPRETFDIQAQGLNYGVRLSFVKLNHEHFRKIKAGFKKFSKDSDSVYLCRNEEIAGKNIGEAEYSLQKIWGNQ